MTSETLPFQSSQPSFAAHQHTVDTPRREAAIFATITETFFFPCVQEPADLALEAPCPRPTLTCWHLTKPKSAAACCLNKDKAPRNVTAEPSCPVPPPPPAPPQVGAP